MKDDFKADILKQLIKPTIRTKLVSPIYRAYSMAHTIIDQTEFLSWAVGRDLFPHIRNCAVEFELKRMIDSGSIPFDYRVVQNAASNCNHLEIKAGNCTMTVSHVTKRYQVPRISVFRENNSFDNQLFWGEFLKEQDIQVPNHDDGHYSAILTHGHLGKIPDFVNLGMPNPGAKSWGALIDLVKEPRLVDCEFSNTDEEEEVTLTFNESIQKMLRGEKKGVL